MEGKQRLLQLLAFTTGPAINVVQQYFELKIIGQGTDFEDYLNDPQNKHKLFHERYPKVPCCECIRTTSIAASSKRGCLGYQQFSKLYDENGTVTAGHEQINRSKISQHCICKVSAQKSIKVIDIDITLLNAIIQHCCNLHINAKIAQWMQVIKEVRDTVSHLSEGKLEKIMFEQTWKKLEKATLQCAGDIGHTNVKIFQMLIDLITTCSVDQLEKRILQTTDKLSEVHRDLNGIVPTVKTVLSKQNELGDQLCSQSKELTEVKKLVSGVNSIVEQTQDVMEKVDIKTEERTNDFTMLKEDIGDVKHMLKQIGFKIGMTLQQQGEIHGDRAKGERKGNLTLDVNATSTDWDEEKTTLSLKNEMQAVKERVDNDYHDDTEEFIIEKVENKCIHLELSASPDVFGSPQKLRIAIKSLINQFVKAGELDENVPATVNINITVKSALTTEEKKVAFTVFSNNDTLDGSDCNEQLQIEQKSRSFVKASTIKLDQQSDSTSGRAQVEGYLELKKRSVFTNYWGKLYNKYWFELRPPGNLEYYKKKPEREGVLPMKNFNILQYTCIETKKEKLFNVVIGDTKLKLRANSAESKEKWMKAITAIQDRQLSQFMPSSNRLSTISNDSTMFDDISWTQNKDESKDVVPSEAAEMSGSFQDSKKPVRMVAAIDFGTSSSGAAFSTRESFARDPLKIEFIQLDKQKGYQKTQTSVLFDEEGFLAFGEQAEHKFKLLSSQKKKKNLYFFKTFKMQLHGGKLSKSTKLRSLAGDKEMKCAIVIAACIEHIKEKAIERMKEMIPGIEEEIDIHWVLTVPAIWSEQARQFMIKAAEKAGIERDNLSLALEPECAALHCKHELWKKEGQTDSSFDPFQEGSQFMVVDLGGGTVDITVSEILKEGKIKEISKASGGKWGGNTINKKIVKIFDELFGQEMPRLRTDKYSVYLKLMADIEQAKRLYDGDDQLMIDIPKPLQDKIDLKKVSKKFGNQIEICDENELIYLSQEYATRIFRECISDITNHVKGLLDNAKGVSIIILVGGYASSAVVKKVFEEVFKDKVLLIRPQNPEIAVLSGAVIAGHSIDPIIGRVAKYNYGIGIKASKRDSGEGNLQVLIADENCVKIFQLLIEKNRKIEVGKYVGSCKIKVDSNKHLNDIGLFITTDDHPKEEINSEDFSMIGTIKFNIPELKQPTTFVVSIRYNETEFRVSAEVENGRHTFEGIIQYF